jgi:small subunit ribosomal protein S1
MSSDSPEKSFAALFEETRQGAQRTRSPRVGETFDVVVVHVGKDAVFVEFSGHQQGLIEAVALRDPDGNLTTSVGSAFRARVVQVGDGQDIRLVPILAPRAEASVAASVTVTVGAGAEAQPTKLAVGQVVSGEVSRVESYGVFLQIEGTRGRAGRGLVPVSELGTPRGADLRKAFPLGTKLKSKVIEIAEGKIRLSVRGLKDDEERAQFDGFREKETAAPAPGFGTFGDLLRGRRGK